MPRTQKGLEGSALSESQEIDLSIHQCASFVKQTEEAVRNRRSVRDQSSDSLWRGSSATVAIRFAGDDTSHTCGSGPLGHARLELGREPLVLEHLYPQVSFSGAAVIAVPCVDADLDAAVTEEITLPPARSSST